MATKSFRIGECAIGGIIKADVVGWSGDIVQIKALDWNTKKVVKEQTFLTSEPQCSQRVEEFLMDLTTCYHAGKIMEWIKSKLNVR
jgi:hypothetical protein